VAPDRVQGQEREDRRIGSSREGSSPSCHEQAHDEGNRDHILEGPGEPIVRADRERSEEQTEAGAQAQSEAGPGGRMCIRRGSRRTVHG
jgi:hypothetical protein